MGHNVLSYPTTQYSFSVYTNLYGTGSSMVLPPFFTKPSNTFLKAIEKVLEGFVARNT
jgi:hypothetical protein